MSDLTWEHHDHCEPSSRLWTCNCEERGYKAALRAPLRLGQHQSVRMISERMVYPPPRHRSFNWFLVFLILMACVTALLVAAAWPIIGKVLLAVGVDA